MYTLYIKAHRYPDHKVNNDKVRLNGRIPAHWVTRAESPKHFPRNTFILYCTEFHHTELMGFARIYKVIRETVSGGLILGGYEIMLSRKKRLSLQAPPTQFLWKPLQVDDISQNTMRGRLLIHENYKDFLHFPSTYVILHAQCISSIKWLYLNKCNYTTRVTHMHASNAGYCITGYSFTIRRMLLL